MSPEQVNRTPLYLACIMLGAISPDHDNVRMSVNDFQRYYGAQAMQQFGL